MGLFRYSLCETLKNWLAQAVLCAGPSLKSYRRDQAEILPSTSEVGHTPNLPRFYFEVQRKCEEIINLKFDNFNKDKIQAKTIFRVI